MKYRFSFSHILTALLISLLSMVRPIGWILNDLWKNLTGLFYYNMDRNMLFWELKGSCEKSPESIPRDWLIIEEKLTLLDGQDDQIAKIIGFSKKLFVDLKTKIKKSREERQKHRT